MDKGDVALQLVKGMLIQLARKGVLDRQMMGRVIDGGKRPISGEWDVREYLRDLEDAIVNAIPPA